MESAPFKLIVFDFDGTLCDSADVKTEAFYRLYLDEHDPEFAGSVREYHLANAGVSRYDKIRYVERHFIGTEPDEERVEAVALRFSNLVEQAVVDAPIYDGVLDFLENRPTGTFCTIASATPTEELRRITDRKRMTDLFDAIEGSPRSKGDIIRGFITEFDVDAQQTVMVGDQPSDVRGAAIAGTAILVVTPADSSWANGLDRVGNFAEAADWLRDRT